MKNFNFTIILLVIIAACTKEKKPVQNVVPVNMDIQLQTICSLKENINLFKDISSFTIVNDSNFAISSINPSQVFLYDFKGNQLVKVGKNGNGPYEYLTPSLVKSYENRIYIWCSTKLKLFVFDIYGNPMTEYTNFNKAIKNFLITDNYFVIYSAGGFDDGIIQLYDLNKKEFVKKSFGNQSNEHKILNAFQCSGALALNNNKVLFCSNDQAIINEIDINNLQLVKYPINDPQFKVEKVKMDHVQFLANVNSSIRYIFSSDLITGIYCTDKYYIVSGESGKVIMDGFNFKDTSARRLVFYVIDMNMKLAYTIKSKIIKGNNSCLYTSNKKDLFNITYNENDSMYHLNKIVLPIK
jgi:WD40 repeat protein